MALIRNKNHLFALIIIVVIIISVFLPVKFPYRIKAQGKILPAKEWILHKQTDGSLLTVFRDNQQNVIKTYAAYQVERGDILKFQMATSLNQTGHINCNDTVGYISSNEVNREIKRLRGELAIAKASLQMNLSGEKTSIIQEAEDWSALSRERAELQSKILERQVELYEKELISQESLEIAQGTAKIYELESNMAQAQLQTLQTGVKPEHIQLIESEIKSKNDELTVLEERSQSYILCSPLDGNVLSMVSEDTLLIVADTMSVVIMPINWQYFAEVNTDQDVTIDYEVSGEKIVGKLVKVNRFMQLLMGEQIFIATAYLNTSNLPRNMVVTCSISGRPRSALEHVTRFIENIFM
ncbi:MAG: hypothetical protein AMS23_00285 [Bacteroides sp. SM1_62]|nr:MAG: hypothetical protein AMS26_09600 [Bacteroides sp. SM23_62]KPL26779.1 MAG: hypothetical protein AMS23_00285 [Bacteroides sp. SM1_62]